MRGCARIRPRRAGALNRSAAVWYNTCHERHGMQGSFCGGGLNGSLPVIRGCAGSVQGRGEDKELGRVERPQGSPGMEGKALRHARETSQDGPRSRTCRTARDAAGEGHFLFALVHRVRDARPRLRRLEPVQEVPSVSRLHARTPLLGLGEDRAGEGRLRLHVARSAGARDGRYGHQAVDMHIIRQPSLGQRLQARDAREAGDGQPGVVRRVAPLREGARREVPRRGRRMGDMERAVQSGAGIRRDGLPHGKGHTRGPAEGEVLCHGDSVDEGLVEERLLRRP